MFGLVDCNNFYASCERVFNPYWVGRPVVVLSNNDGCVIARSNEVKKLGIEMGVPAFQIKDLVDRYNIGVFSSNYTLYGDMSNRVMTMLSSFVQDIEIYSIDEAFLDLHGYERYNLEQYGREIVRKVTKGTGIPVSMGIAPTKTLAKVANKFAKKYPGYKGACLIDTEEKRIKALQLFEIGDVWGIGHRHERKLKAMGVNTAYDFTQLSRAWVRKNMTVVGERTWRELQGEPCVDMEMVEPRKKTICTSRAFGESATTLADMEEAVSTYAGMCAEKLRKQKSCAASLMVFIHTNHFNPNARQYARNCVLKFNVPSSNTNEIVKQALTGLRLIFKDGYTYKKAGVIITEIVPADAIQMNLFDTKDREKLDKVSTIMDQLNSGFKHQVLRLAVQGTERKWKLKQEKLSGCYTTKLSDIIIVKCK